MADGPQVPPVRPSGTRGDPTAPAPRPDLPAAQQRHAGTGASRDGGTSQSGEGSDRVVTVVGERPLVPVDVPRVVAAWLVVVVAAIGIGPLVELQVQGQPVVVSAIDVAAVALGVHGLVDVARRGWRTGWLLLPLACLLGVLGVQLLTVGDPVAVVGGISRFVVAGGVLFGLGQLTAGRADLLDGQPASPHGTAVGVGPGHPSSGAVVVVATADGGDVPVREGAPTWAWVLVAGGAVLALAVLWDWVGAVADPARGNFYEVKNSVVVPLGASNYVAAFVVVPLLVGLAWWREDRRLRWATALAGLGVLATMSRAALVAVAVVLGAAAVTRRVGPRRGAVLGAGVLLVLVGAVLLANSGWVGDPPPGLRTPVGDRTELFVAAADAARAEPVLGVGINRFATVNDAGQDHAHNLVLHGLATTGIVGTVVHLWWWSLLAAALWRGAPGPARDALALAGGGLLVHSQLEALSHTRAVEVLVAVLVVLAATQVAPRLPRSRGAPAWTSPRSSSSTSGPSTRS